MENIRSEKGSMSLSAPNTGENVRPRQVCLAFEPRADTPSEVKQCWYCRCADFHLHKSRSLDLGLCYWPKKITT